MSGGLKLGHFARATCSYRLCGPLVGGRRTPRRAHGNPMYTLYSMQRSGNSYKVRLALAQLGVSYRLVEVDTLRGESRTPEFLAKNPSGQVPLLEVADGRFIAEQGAGRALASRSQPRPRFPAPTVAKKSHSFSQLFGKC